jgi:transposase InsO family protein
MAESFVKTLKRDYAKLANRPDSKTVMAQLQVWFDDYNSYHPHSALGYLPPTLFRKKTIGNLNIPTGLDYGVKTRCIACQRRFGMDNGPEMTSQTPIEWAEKMGIELLFIQPGKPNQNAFVERFNRSFRDEVLDANLFNSIAEAQEAADVWVTDYNEFRTRECLCENVRWSSGQGYLILESLVRFLYPKWGI